jgi:hypothetical protein
MYLRLDGTRATPRGQFENPATGGNKPPLRPVGFETTYLLFDKKTGELLKVGEVGKSSLKDRWSEYGRIYIAGEWEAWKDRPDWTKRELLFRFVYVEVTRDMDARTLEGQWRRAIEKGNYALMPWDYRDRGKGNATYSFMMYQKPQEFEGTGPSLNDPEVGYQYSEWYKKAKLP